MIFSIQKTWDFYSMFFVTLIDVPIHVWQMIEIMRRDFSEHHQKQVPNTKNQLGANGMMSKVAEKVGVDYPEVPDYRYEAQLVNNFLFPWEEQGSGENPIRRG